MRTGSAANKPITNLPPPEPRVQQPSLSQPQLGNDDRSNNSTSAGIKLARNFGNPVIADIDNKDALRRGADPFKLAGRTRGTQFENSALSIARDVLNLQHGLRSEKGQPTVGTNPQAARVVEQAIDLSKPVSNETMAATSRFNWGTKGSDRILGDGAKATLDRLLVQLYRNGTFFGSPKVKQAAAGAMDGAAEAGHHIGRPPALGDQAFVKAVFQGDFRRDALEQKQKTLFGPQEVASGLLVSPAAAEGFFNRMKADEAGGTLAALNIAPSRPDKSFAMDDRQATNALISQLIPRLKTRDVDGSGLYDAFKLLNQADRQKIADEVNKSRYHAADLELFENPKNRGPSA